MVVAAGDSPEAQALLGAHRGLVGGATLRQYRGDDDVLGVPDGTVPADGRLLLRQPAHRARHGRDDADGGPHRTRPTAAASRTSGRCCNRICLADGVPLVNIVRRPEQVEMLREHRAPCTSATPSARRSSTTSPRR